MQNIFIKTTTLVLCLLIILTACEKKQDITDNTSQTTTLTAPVSKNTDQSEYNADYLPQDDYEGYKFKLLSCKYPNGFSIVTIADTNEENGDIINDAYYKRNLEIEEKYNIQFSADYVNEYFEMTDQFKKQVLSDSDEYDMIMLICRDAFKLAQEKMMVKVSELPYVDITQPWYVHTINDALTINHELNFAYSDDAVNLFEWTNLVLFNKKYAASYGMDDFYKSVQDGKWTIDSMFSAARKAISDLNGDGTYNDMDRLGIICEADFYYPSFWVGSDLNTVEKDSNDIPYLAAASNEKFYKLLTDIVNQSEEPGMHFDMFFDKTVTIDKGIGDQQRTTGHDLFSNGVSLFHITNVGALQNIREMADDFGILPIPKYDEAQENYKSRTIDGWLYCVPVTNTDLKRTSVIMEAMAIGAKKIIVPSYYEVSLKEKYTRDLDSKEMLELIYNTRAFDMGDVFWLDAIRNTYTFLMINGKTDFASATEKNLNSMTKVINDAVNSFTT